MSEELTTAPQETNDQALAWLQDPNAPGKQVEPIENDVDAAEKAEIEQAQATFDAQQAAQVAPITPEPELTPVAQMQYDQAVVGRDLDKDSADKLKTTMLSNPDNVVKQ